LILLAARPIRKKHNKTSGIKDTSAIMRINEQNKAPSEEIKKHSVKPRALGRETRFIE
jgi:hypothetical protein